MEDRTFSIQRERLTDLEADVHHLLPNDGREIFRTTKIVNNQHESRLLIKQPLARSRIIDDGIAEEIEEISEGWNEMIAGENPYAADDVVGRWYEQVRIELSYSLEEVRRRELTGSEVLRQSLPSGWALMEYSIHYSDWMEREHSILAHRESKIIDSKVERAKEIRRKRRTVTCMHSRRSSCHVRCSERTRHGCMVEVHPRLSDAYPSG